MCRISNGQTGRCAQPGSAIEPRSTHSVGTVIYALEPTMNPNTLDRLVFHVALLTGLIALVLLPW